MRRISPFLLLLAGLTGCAGNDLIVQRQSSLEGRLEQVMQAHNSTKADFAAVSAQLQEFKDHSAKLTASEKDLQLKYDALQEKVKMLASRLSMLELAAKQSSTIELVNQDSIPEGRDESVQAAYMKAFGLFSANSYSAAAEAFNSFISVYPESEYAANARYWLGECYFSLGNYKEAIESFTRVLEMSPLPKRGADAMYRIGLAWYRLDNPSKGATALGLLIEKYPGSEAAKMAAEQLGKK